MPYWNEELQQWGYHYYEEVSSFQWFGIERNIMSYGYEQSEQTKSAIRLNGNTQAFTVRDRIEQQLAQLDAHKEQLLKFRDLLDKNPDTEQILNLSRQVGI